MKKQIRIIQTNAVRRLTAALVAAAVICSAAGTEIVSAEAVSAADVQQTAGAAVTDGQQAAGAVVTDGQQAAGAAVADGQQAAGAVVADGQQAAGAVVADGQQAAGAVVADGQQAVGEAAVSEPAVTEAPFDARELLQLSKNSAEFWADCPKRDVELLTPNPFSRPQEALDTVNNIVIHYVGNAGSSAMDNRNYFESLKDSQERSASSHFVIGLDGEIVQCIPLSEVAYATKQRNNDTISIECCHPDADGKFNEYTYWSLVELSAWLCKQFHLDPQAILRHYDVTGKLCPLYYVEHPEEWQVLKDTIEKRLNELLAVNP